MKYEYSELCSYMTEQGDGYGKFVAPVRVYVTLARINQAAMMGWEVISILGDENGNRLLVTLRREKS